MRTSRLAGAFLLALAMSVWSGYLRAQTRQPAVEAPMPCLEETARQLSNEIRAVRLELQLLVIDYSARLLGGLQRELEWVQARREKLAAAQRRAQEEIAALDRLEKDPALSETERRALKDVQANRDLEPGSEMARIQAEQEQLVRREAELTGLIGQERQRGEQARLTAASLQDELSRRLQSAAGKGQ